MVAATLGKNLGPPMSNRSNDSYLQENQELQKILFQTNVVKKQLIPLLN